VNVVANAGTTFSCRRLPAPNADPFQLGATAIRQVEPVARHVQSYQEELMRVLTGTQSEFVRTAEQRMPEARRGAMAVADEFARGAAEASEAFITRH
jgi:hypothetical protein